jgi:plastocyanin
MITVFDEVYLGEPNDLKPKFQMSVFAMQLLQLEEGRTCTWEHTTRGRHYAAFVDQRGKRVSWDDQ